MSRLIYRGIELTYIRTQDIAREPQYSDDGLEYLYTKVTITVEAVLNAALLPLVGTAPAVADGLIRHYLETPRGNLQFWVGTNKLYDITAPDAKAGPFPVVNDLVQIGGTRTFKINYTVVTYVVECPAGFGAANFQSWRYSQILTLDENWYSTLTTMGKIVMRADKNLQIDALRGLVAPPIPQGFKRISSIYNIQSDYLAANFTWVDEEQYLEPPTWVGATKAEGEYTESTPKGAKRVATVRISLTGNKTAVKSNLIGAALLIGTSKLDMAGLQNGNKTLLIGTIRESLWSNEVEINLQANLKAKQERVLTNSPGQNGGGDAKPAYLAMDLRRFGVALPGAEPGVAPLDLGIRGTATVQLLGAILHDPCVKLGELSTTTLGQNTLVGKGPVPEAIVTLTPLLPNDFGALYKDDKPGIYEGYEMRSYYERQENVMQLPVASSFSTVSSVFVRTAKPQIAQICEWSGEKSFNKPVLAGSPAQTDPNAVQLNTIIAPSSPDLAADGSTIVFPSKGKHVVGYKQTDQVVFNHPRPPWMNPVANSQLFITGSDVETGLFTLTSTGKNIISTKGGEGQGY